MMSNCGGSGAVPPPFAPQLVVLNRTQRQLSATGAVTSVLAGAPASRGNIVRYSSARYAGEEKGTRETSIWEQ